MPAGQDGDIPLVGTKKPTVGDYIRSGSCVGEPRVRKENGRKTVFVVFLQQFLFKIQSNALNCLRSGDLTVFADIVNEPDQVQEEGDAEAGTSNSTFPVPASHWLNAPIPEEEDRTLLSVAVDMGLADFVSVLLRAGADAGRYSPELGRCPVHEAAARGDEKVLGALLDGPEGNSADPNAR